MIRQQIVRLENDKMAIRTYVCDIMIYKVNNHHGGAGKDYFCDS